MKFHAPKCTLELILMHQTGLNQHYAHEKTAERSRYSNRAVNMLRITLSKILSKKELLQRKIGRKKKNKIGSALNACKANS